MEELWNLYLLFWCKFWESSDLARTLCQNSERWKRIQRLDTVNKTAGVQQLRFSVCDQKVMSLNPSTDRDTAVKNCLIKTFFFQLLSTEAPSNIYLLTEHATSYELSLVLPNNHLSLISKMSISLFNNTVFGAQHHWMYQVSFFHSVILDIIITCYHGNQRLKPDVTRI